MSTFNPLLHNLSQHRLGSFSLANWVVGLCLAGGLLTWFGWLPPHPYAAIFWLALAGLLAGLALHGRKNYFVTFRPDPAHTVEAQKLPASSKLPVQASGFFGVEGRQNQFTWLQGYYRTFPSREHALLCWCQQSRFWFFGRRPESDVGMWYIFFHPAEMVSAMFGQLIFGSHVKPGLQINYRLTIPKSGRFSQRVRMETIYLAFEAVQDAEAALADLLVDLGNDRQT